MAFFKSKANPSVPEKGGSPYLNGREKWLERYGSYISRAAQWRMAAFLCLMITVVSITGNVIQANQVKTIPYIIEVDALGKAGVVAPGGHGQQNPATAYPGGNRQVHQRLAHRHGGRGTPAKNDRAAFLLHGRKRQGRFAPVV